MEKRKHKHGNSKDEPKKKKIKKIKHDTKGIESSDVFVAKSGSKDGKKQTVTKNDGKKNKTFNQRGKFSANKKMKKTKVEKSVKKPISMQNLLSEKLKIVQQNRLEKAGETKTVKVEETKEELNRTNDTDKSVAMGLDIDKSVEKGENVQKKKKEKKRKQSTVQDNVEETSGVLMKTESQGDGKEEEDPEKAAIRKKKREKRKQKKLEKERMKQQYKEKAGTAKTAAIDYLNQWKNSREEWKFLKVRQVWLLQNMYDNALVDDDTFEILLEYLEGLQGKSKQVTVSEAEKVLAKAEADEEGASAESFERARQIIQLLSDD